MFFTCWHLRYFLGYSKHPKRVPNIKNVDIFFKTRVKTLPQLFKSLVVSMSKRVQTTYQGNVYLKKLVYQIVSPEFPTMVL